MLIYQDLAAWDNWQLEWANTDESKVVTYYSTTDGYAMMATL